VCVSGVRASNARWASGVNDDEREAAALIVPSCDSCRGIGPIPVTRNCNPARRRRPNANAISPGFIDTDMTAASVSGACEGEASPRSRSRGWGSRRRSRTWRRSAVHEGGAAVAGHPTRTDDTKGHGRQFTGVRQDAAEPCSSCFFRRVYPSMEDVLMEPL